MKKNHRTILIISAIIIILIICGIFYLNFVTPPYITSVEKTDSIRLQDKMIINIYVNNHFYKLNKDTWCLVTTNDEIPAADSDEWLKAVNGYCNFTVDVGNYKVYVKDKYNNINSLDNQNVKIDKVIQIKPKKDVYYLYKGQRDTITYDLNIMGNADKTISFGSSNKTLVEVDEHGNIIGNNYGSVDIELKSVNGVKATVKVYVSPFITSPKVDTSKKYLTCGQFNYNEAKLVDNMLFDRIDKAGYKTRAGVVAAARFITLEFSFRVHYFYENGRLNNYKPYLHVDGEGRYYHRGMYLNKSKFSDIKSSFVGPATWGCDLQNYTDWGPYVTGKYYPNGLDCSGFVTWALLNGGFDVGDIGAGENVDHNDLDDLGEKVYITNDLINSGRVKPGDLIGFNGHMAILAGWDDNNYYIAESLNTTGGVVMTVVAKNKLARSMYKYIILMDNVYKEDGNLTNMW